MKLYSRSYSKQGPPLLILHGLFGNQANWSGQARVLAEDYAVHGLDLRNHGRSPWDARHDYPALAEDLGDTLDALGIERAHLMGHSMGGKAAMQFAFQAPARVASLIVVDIAPVSYERESFAPLEGMLAVDFDRARSRADVEEQLATKVRSSAVRDFLLTNLRREPEGSYRWRCNLDALSANWDEINGFPPPGRFDGKVLFVKGGTSDYIQAEHTEVIQEAFPKVQFKMIAQAGHWVHSEKPHALLKVVGDFLATAV